MGKLRHGLLALAEPGVEPGCPAPETKLFATTLTAVGRMYLPNIAVMSRNLHVLLQCDLIHLHQEVASISLLP